MEDFLISMAASVILRMIEDPNGRGKWRRMLFKLFRAIGAAFVDDPELRGMAKELSRS